MLSVMRTAAEHEAIDASLIDDQDQQLLVDLHRFLTSLPILAMADTEQKSEVDDQCTNLISRLELKLSL